MNEETLSNTKDYKKIMPSSNFQIQNNEGKKKFKEKWVAQDIGLMVGANHDTANMQTHRDPCLGSDSAQTDNDLQKELDIQYMKGTY